MNKHTFFTVLSLIFLSLSGIVLIGLQNLFGWCFAIAGITCLLGCKKDFSKDIILIYVSLIILSFSHINTDISYYHMLEMGGSLSIALLLPYVISRYVYKEHSITFPFSNGRVWSKKEIAYIILAGIIAYFLIPFYLKNTSAYLNWDVNLGTSHIIRLFIGTNALGIWDELFFISTVLGLLRKHIPFFWANALQAILFTCFLYELGFTGWGFIMIYLFALIQGLIFKKTESLAYVITIHLLVDLILFLALIDAHYPNHLPFF